MMVEVDLFPNVSVQVHNVNKSVLLISLFASNLNSAILLNIPNFYRIVADSKGIIQHVLKNSAYQSLHKRLQTDLEH